VTGVQTCALPISIEDHLPYLAAELRQMYEPSQDTVPTAGALK